MKENIENESIKLINDSDSDKKDIIMIKENKQNQRRTSFIIKQNSSHSSHKLPNFFKLNLLKGILYLDEHLNFFTFIKFIFGLIFLVLPLIIIILIVYLDSTEKNRYIFFPFFVSVCLIVSSLLIFGIMKLSNSCRISGIFIESYERIAIFKIAKFIFAGFILLWFLFICENFVFNFNLMKEKVTQSKEKEIGSKIFDEGTYFMRLLFILLFWDLEKIDGKYTYEELGYFDYEDSFFYDFQKIFGQLLIPIITFCFCGIFKIILIKTKRGLIYFILYIITIFISFYILFYDVSKDNTKIKDKEEDEKYFIDTKMKYLEIIPITLIILLLIMINAKVFIIDLKHKKYYSYKNKSKNLFVAFLIICSYLINTSGFILFLYLLYDLYLYKITHKFPKNKFDESWRFIYISLLLIFSGYAFPFGHYYFKLLFHSTVFENFDHYLKNDFYTSSSGNIKKSSTLYQKRISEKSF